MYSKRQAAQRSVGVSVKKSGTYIANVFPVDVWILSLLGEQHKEQGQTATTRTLDVALLQLLHPLLLLRFEFWPLLPDVGDGACCTARSRAHAGGSHRERPIRLRSRRLPLHECAREKNKQGGNKKVVMGDAAERLLRLAAFMWDDQTEHRRRSKRIGLCESVFLLHSTLRWVSFAYASR